ncbi:unnamed protein product [Bursaphelenchus okinawaensis]|uniref:Uncharacterized protein n=1 Tax=Bursaphelenchus okinawaensis TaxID=465554 RepID=A0A811LS39_9BILA|nr:unnamed protein product [Bursaphelenchus okinawaensis]CAG9127143.1 unnamed protein product [Bursaphelenchus okinawaensis]
MPRHDNFNTPSNHILKRMENMVIGVGSKRPKSIAHTTIRGAFGIIVDVRQENEVPIFMTISKEYKDTEIEERFNKRHFAIGRCVEFVIKETRKGPRIDRELIDVRLLRRDILPHEFRCENGLLIMKMYCIRGDVVPLGRSPVFASYIDDDLALRVGIPHENSAEFENMKESDDFIFEAIYCPNYMADQYFVVVSWCDAYKINPPWQIFSFAEEAEKFSKYVLPNGERSSTFNNFDTTSNMDANSIKYIPSLQLSTSSTVQSDTLSDGARSGTDSSRSTLEVPPSPSLSTDKITAANISDMLGVTIDSEVGAFFEGSEIISGYN